MGTCFSSSKVTGSNSNAASSGANAANTRKTITKPPPITTTKREVPHCSQQKAKETAQKHQQQQQPRNSNVKASSRKGVIPCGKRTDFGYDKDFGQRYSLGKLLGHGQFGYTYVATDKSNGDRVAVKRIEKSKMLLPIAVEDVRREVKILKALAGHENVVQFHNAFEDENYVYIVMELCEGGELLDRILAK
nr:calcium-dependent protein kinase 28-like [Ipomoea batatas]GMC94865.1 calcium-dependent protein kinase 28-like [Ipomoea batatas]GMC94867.1 calcium-dependent protein kinase 28-like [Ipomoea batatas]